jgi:hypothetical protein
MARKAVVLSVVPIPPPFGPSYFSAFSDVTFSTYLKAMGYGGDSGNGLLALPCPRGPAPGMALVQTPPAAAPEPPRQPN